MALVNTGSDSWLLEFTSCERLSKEVTQQINARDKERPGSTTYDLLSEKIRVRLKQFSTELSQLDSKLRSIGSKPSLSTEEHDRRKRDIETLRNRLIQMERRCKQGYQKNVTLSMETTGWGDDEDEELIPTSISSVSELRDQQSRLLKDQDASLEALSKVISRQQDIAHAINREVIDQSSILDDIGDGMDQADTRIQSESRMIHTISKKDSTCGYWVVIVLLLVIILAVGFT